jgi:ribulose-5-phosphate 4-epimerase/fuculose-1-phosphate aldolase
MKEEGVIKFNCTWIKAAPLNIALIEELNAWRDKLFKAQLIGVNKEGIGYGNISIRFQQDKFIISGSATGKLKNLEPEHYTLVTDYDLDKNTLTTVGPIKASSESLTHAVIYESQKSINAVMHIHHLKLWNKLLDTLPSTRSNIEYGTIEMAGDIVRLLKNTNLSEQKIFAMAGHEGGIISFGKDLNEAGQVIFDKLLDLRRL